MYEIFRFSVVLPKEQSSMYRTMYYAIWSNIMNRFHVGEKMLKR